MKMVQVSPQKANALCKKHLGGCKLPTTRDEYFLPGGAKLVKSSGKYYVSGYSQDGSDVDMHVKLKDSNKWVVRLILPCP